MIKELELEKFKGDMMEDEVKQRFNDRENTLILWDIYF